MKRLLFLLPVLGLLALSVPTVLLPASSFASQASQLQATWLADIHAGVPASELAPLQARLSAQPHLASFYPLALHSSLLATLREQTNAILARNTHSQRALAVQSFALYQSTLPHPSLSMSHLFIEEEQQSRTPNDFAALTHEWHVATLLLPLDAAELAATTTLSGLDAQSLAISSVRPDPTLLASATAYSSLSDDSRLLVSVSLTLSLNAAITTQKPILVAATAAHQDLLSAAIAIADLKPYVSTSTWSATLSSLQADYLKTTTTPGYQALLTHAQALRSSLPNHVFIHITGNYYSGALANGTWNVTFDSHPGALYLASHIYSDGAGWFVLKPGSLITIPGYGTYVVYSVWLWPWPNSGNPHHAPLTLQTCNDNSGRIDRMIEARRV